MSTSAEQANKRIYADYREAQALIGRLYNTTTPMPVIAQLQADLEQALRNELKTSP